ncbi:MAG TPA: PAS domain-containing protein, partial [Candidatus Obscuribacterales bacterium]
QEVGRRKLMEQMLFQSRSLLNNILNSSLDGIFVFQAVRDGHGAISDFEFLIANPAALKLVGSPPALLGKRLLEVFPGIRRDGLFDAYIALVETGQPLKQELYLDHDGVQGWFHLVGVKLGDGLSVTFRNISELRLYRSPEAVNS